MIFDIGKNLKVKETFAGLVFGIPGVGKTTLGLSCKNPLLLDCDDGVERVEFRHRDQVPVLKPRTFNEIIDIVVNLDKHMAALSKQVGREVEVDTIVIDTIGSLVEYMLEQVMLDDLKLRQRDGSPTLKAYGAISLPFKSLLAAIKTQGKSVLFIGHADERNDGNQTTYRVMCVGSTANKLMSMLDFVGFVDMLGNKRVITFTPSERAYAKNSLSLPPVIDLPNTDTAPNDFMQKMITDAIKKRADACNSEQQVKYDELIKEIKEKVASVKDVEGLNGTLSWGATLPIIWESKSRLWQLIQEKAKELKLDFDSETKQFIIPKTEEKPNDGKVE